jgi:hypothetical protein
MPIIGQNNFSSLPLFDKAVADNPSAKRALCFGDSWFQYPPDPIDLNKQLAKIFKGTLFLNDGMARRDSASWKRGLGDVRREIGTYAFDAILLSNGGNDVVGDELFEFVKTPSQPQSAGTAPWGQIPPDVFDYVRLETFQHALEYAIKDFKEVVQNRDQLSPKSIIYVHTYDYIYPDGRPFKLGPITVGPWVKPAFEQVGLVDSVRQKIVTDWLLQQFARELKAFVSQNANMRLVYSLGTLISKKQWQNEIHPTEAGFRKIAKECWAPLLSGVLV